MQDGEREADGEAALVVAFLLEPVGSVHLIAHVLGNRVVEVFLPGGELVADGVGAAFGE